MAPAAAPAAGLPARAPIAAPPAAPIIAPLARRSPVLVPHPASIRAAANPVIRSLVRMVVLLLNGAGTHYRAGLFRRPAPFWGRARKKTRALAGTSRHDALRHSGKKAAISGGGNKPKPAADGQFVHPCRSARHLAGLLSPLRQHPAAHDSEALLRPI